MEEIKKNDFLATLVKNPDLSVVDLKDNNITPDNSSLLSKDEYLRIEGVRNADVFKNDAGQFDEKKFDTYYKNAQILYANFANDEFLKNLSNNLTYGEDEWFAPKDAIKRPQAPIVVRNQIPTIDAQGIAYITEITQDGSNFSIREQAQREKVVDFETGEELDYSPNDKAGLFSRYTLPSLVIAQWDDDGVHVENGIEIQHKEGDLKLNKRGRPYYETLGNRDMYNKDLLRMSDILTVDGSTWNKLDFFDSDDKEKSFGKTALNLVARIAPMFIPVVGEVYGYITMSEALLRVLPTIGKATNRMLFGGSDKVNDVLNVWESYMGRFDPTASDYGREHFVSFENIGNMIGDISGQLFQQRAISTLPTIIKKMSGSAKDVTNISRNLSLAYMAATSVQDVYGDFKNAGASDMVAGLGMWASMLSIYGLMHSDYFRDNFWKDTFMDESELRGAIRGASKETADRLVSAAQITTTKQAATFLQKASNFYQKNLLNAMQNKGVSGIIARGISEGTEEVMEEATTDAVKALTAGLGALGVPVTKPETNLDFGWSGTDFATRYLSSAFGGFIGGMVFAGQNRYEKWLNKTLYKLPDINPNDMERLIYGIATGKRKEIDFYLNKWYKKGLLGNKNLTIDGKTEFTPDGSSVFIPDGKGVDQNTAVYETLKNVLDTIEQVINSEVDIKYLTPEGFEQLTLLGFNIDEIKKNPNLIGASTLVALKDYGSYQNDLYKNISDLVKTKIALQARIKELSQSGASTEDEKKTQADNIENDAVVKNLQEQLKELRKKKDDLFAGKYNKYYSGQAYFAANKPLYQNFVNLDQNTFVKLKYGRNFNSYTKEQQEVLSKEFDDYSNTTGRNNIYKAYDLYLDLSKKYADVIEENSKKLEDALKRNNLPKPTYGIQTFNELAKFKNELQKILNVDEASRTPEQIKRISELEIEINKLALDLQHIISNPGLADISTAEDIDVYTGKTKGEKLNLYDDKSALNVARNSSTAIDFVFEPTKLYLDELRKQYKNDANSENFRYNDAALELFLSKIISSFKENIGVNQGFDYYQQTFIYDDPEYYDFDNGDFVDGLFSKIELDESDPKWLTGRIDNETEIKRLAQEILNNIGRNNEAAKNSYNTLLTEIGKSSKLLEAGNEKYLKDFLNHILPTIDGKNIYDIVVEFDNYRSKINYSVFGKIAQTIGTDLINTNLFDLVQQEYLHLANSNQLTDYIINNPSINSSFANETITPIVKAINAIISGAADGTNAVINNFKEDADNMPHLVEMSKDISKMIVEQGNNFLDRIAFLRTLSEQNSNRAIKKHKDTTINMRPKFLNAVLSIADSINTELGIDVKSMWDGPDAVTESNYKEFEQKCIDFEQNFYNEIQNKFGEITDKDKQKEFAKKLLNLVNKETLFKTMSTKLSQNEDEVIGELDLIYYLATIGSLPIENFYAAYKSFLPDNLLPIPGHEFTIKQVVAQAINPYLFNALLDEIKSNANYDGISDVAIKYLKAKPNLHNLSTVIGSAGTGKTVGVVVNIIKALTHNLDSQIIFLAKEQNQADNIMENANAGIAKVKAETVDAYCTKVFGESIKDYELNKETNHVESKSSISSVGSEFDEESKLKLLVIDEIETLTEAELDRICADAEDAGIFIIGAGDLKQPPTSINLIPTGIEDCNFVRTPSLSVSMRAGVIAKVLNADLLGNALDTVLKEAQTNPELTLNDRDGLIDSNLKNAELYYYYDSESGKIYGDMQTNDDADFNEKIKRVTALDGVKIGIIVDADKVAEYKIKYNLPGKVDIVPYEKRAGGEWDYVFVDVDLKAHNKSVRGVSKYLLTQDVYTLTQRSRLGTLIKSGDLDLFTFKNDPNKINEISIPKTESEEFRKWRFDCLDNITNDPNALDTVVLNSPLVDKPITPTTTPTTPPPPTVPPTTPPAVPPTVPPTSGPTPPAGPTGPTGPTTLPTGPTPEPSSTASSEPPALGPAPTLGLPPTGPGSEPSPTLEPPPAKPALAAPPVSEKPTNIAETIEKWKNNDFDNITFKEIIDTLASFGIITQELANKIKNTSSDQINEPWSKAFDDDENVIFNELDKYVDWDAAEDIIFKKIEKPNKKQTSCEAFSNAVVRSRNEQYVGTGLENIDITKALDINDVSSIEEIKKATDQLASEFRTGLFEDNNIKDLVINIGLKRKLMKFSFDKYMILPYNVGAELTARFTDGSKYFDIHLLDIDEQPNIFGEYTGPINFLKKLQLRKADRFISLAEFDANYNIHRNNRICVVDVPATTEFPIKTLSARSNDYVKKNIGKPMVTMTDEPALAKRYMQSGSAGYVTEDGATIQAYDKIDIMGVQCIASFDQFFDLIDKYREQTGWNEDSPKVRFTSTAPKNSSFESPYVTGSEVLDDIKFLKDEEGNIRQLLPRNRAAKIIAAALIKSKSAQFALNSLMHVMQSGNAKTGFLVNVDGHDIGLYNGKYEIGYYDSDMNFVPDSKYSLSIDANTGFFDLNQILEQIGYDWNNGLPEVYYTYYSKYPKKEIFIKTLSSNWELAHTVGAIKESGEVNKLIDFLKDNGFSNGIYLDDHAIGNNKSIEKSVYSTLETGNRVYYTDRELVHYSIYGLELDGNIKPIDEIPPKPDPIKPKLTLQQFLDENSLKITANTIDEANAQLKKDSNNWIYKYITGSDGEYTINETDDLNIKNWLKENWKLDLMGTEEEIYDFANFVRSLENNEINRDQGIIVYKTQTGQLLFKESDDRFKFAEDMFYLDSSEIMHNYVASKFFNTVSFDQTNLFDKIKDSFELSQILIKFEDQFEC